MNGSLIFRSTVFTIFLFYPPQTAHLGNFSLLARQMGTLENVEQMSSEEKMASPPAQLVLLPFQNAPGPTRSSVDSDDLESPINDSINDLSPYGKPDPAPSLETHKTGIRFDRCMDTDMCLFIIKRQSDPKERRILVEMFGTDVPRLSNTCEQETVLATAALNLLKEVLSEAVQIDVYDHYKVGRKHIARVVVDGQDLSELLISQGLAVPKGNGSRNWCAE